MLTVLISAHDALAEAYLHSASNGP
jgi:hypothetical protein